MSREQARVLTLSTNDLDLYFDPRQELRLTTVLAFLYEAGCLSIREVDGDMVILGIPNHEIGVFLANLLEDAINGSLPKP